MKLELPDRNINVFSVLYREESIQHYLFDDIKKVIAESDAYNYTGMLLFESNRGNIDPWVFAQSVLTSSQYMSPFIAVNPVYMHPFAVAKKVLTLCSFYNRKLFLNFITGTSKNDLVSLNDTTSHDDRYKRLSEYIYIINHLLRDPKPLTFDGQFYKVNNLQLSSRLSNNLFPECYVAGASIDAIEVRAKLGTASMSMAQSVDDYQTDAMSRDEKRGVHFGIVTRPDEEDAERRLQELFKGEEGEQELLDLSMSNTDGVWKNILKEESERPKKSGSTYSLLSFKNFKSDCPYHVGSYQQIAEVILKYVANGYTTLVIEIPAGNDEFEYIDKAFKIAKEKILSRYYTSSENLEFDFSF